MVIFRLFIAIIIPLLMVNTLKAQHVYDINFRELFPIADFRLEGDIDGDGQLSLVALDSGNTVDETADGKYTFIINGFIEDIYFKEGVATLNKSISSNGIIFIKYENRVENIYRLYGRIAGLIIPVPLWIVLALPLFIVLLSIVFRRLIYLILILGVVVFFLFSGLDLSSFLNLIKISISSLFN